MRLLAFFAFICSFWPALAGDTIYAREVLKNLTNKKKFGRGYLKSGLTHAEKYILSEIKKTKATPGFGDKYTDDFTHSVNTFPKACNIEIDGKKLRAGYDFIPDPSSPGIKGAFSLKKTDSVTYSDDNNRLRIILKKKLTFSVGNNVDPSTTIELINTTVTQPISKIKIDLENKLISDFKSRNISCILRGTGPGDSMIVFTAHYDHLGGLGKNTWFPGANDNASGVSMLLNLLNYYNASQPRHTLVFIFFAGEEAGLLGSKHYVSHPPIDLKKIKFLINLDLLGTGDDGIMVVNGAVYEKEFARLQALNTDNNLVTSIKKRGKASNSDHYWFTEAGVPAFFIYTMGGRSAYHDVFDTAAGLPLTDYVDVFRLITLFSDGL
jgi:aminopeptidase YwaD